MKFRYAGLLALPLVLLLQACPVGTDYPLGTPGKEKADAGLLGTWASIEGTPEVVKAVVSKKTTNSFTVTVQEKGEMYSLTSMDFTGYTTVLEGKNFLYVQDPEDSKYYLYHYELIGKKGLALYDVSFLEKGMDGITSTETFREEVKASMAKEGGCFSEKKMYQKQ